MKQKIIIALLIIVPLMSKGQYNPQLSQLIKTLEFVNPGYNASKDQASATLLYRKQWMGLEGAPQTMAANINIPINKWHTGFGANALVETFGLTTFSNIDLTACVDVKVSNSSYLTFGLSGGAEIRRIDMERAKYMGDPPFLANQFDDEYLHAGFGLNYFTPSLHLGASAHYSQLKGLRYTNNEPLSVFLNGSYLISIHPDWALKPSMLFKTWGGYSNLDAGVFALYRDILWFGASYRTSKALIFFADIKISNSIRLGYSFDTGLWSSSAFRHNSHEIRLDFTIPRAERTFERHIRQ
ncbi:MAG: PorP/SprF family type IX secretion system membrane protein [Prolixibacteraceae bacterium]|nr:PorP/SprF family type IX secretion system membrane protein [Prolixibacteraceae bacterium]